MSSLIEKIDEILPKNQPDRNTFFQLKYFVIGKEPTIQAKIRKCYQELEWRKTSLGNINIQLEQYYDDLLLMEKELKDEKDEFIIRKINRKQKYIKKEIETLRNKMISLEQECHFIIEMYEYLITIEKPKDWDNFEVQEEYWNKKLTQELQSKIMLGQPVCSEMTQTIMALPDHIPIKRKLMQLVSIPQKKEFIE